MKLVIIGITVALFVVLHSASLRAETLTTDQIIQQLTPSLKTRSLKQYRGITVEGTQREESDASVNLYINFQYDSALIKQDAEITLDRLSAALQNDKLAHLDFLIGGHTDAVGSNRYNDLLSAKRALSVKQYLIERGGVDAHRLLDKGFGKSRLLDPQHPFDAANRRVQIITLAKSPQ